MIQPSRLVFGSCNNQNLTQPLWNITQSRNPSAFVWGGDAIYADYRHPMNWRKNPLISSSNEKTTLNKRLEEFYNGLVDCATPERLEEFYNIQLSNVDYQRFISTNNITVFGTIDDHDMGCNNGDKTFDYAAESGLAFVEFTNEPKSSPMYKRAKKGSGVYGVKVFDFDRAFGQHLVSDIDADIDPDIPHQNSSNYSNKSVAVFVLDSRTNKSPWKRFKDSNGDFLGEEQWRWFEKALSRSKASVNIIVQGLQVHSDRYPNDGNIIEEWSKFPTAQNRLYQTILKSGVEAPLLISGDVHMSQIMRKDCFQMDENNTTYPNRRSLIELTTSGMTHAWGTCFSCQLKYHIGLRSYYAYFASRTFMVLFHFISPWMELMTSSVGTGTKHDPVSYHFENGGGEGAKQGKQYAIELNFGEFEFHWDDITPSVTARVFGRDASSSGTPLLSASWTLDQLSGRTLIPGGFFSNKNDIPPNDQMQQQEWQCVPYRGISHPIHIVLGNILGVVVFLLLILPMVSPFVMCMYILFSFRGRLKGYIWMKNKLE